MKTNSAEKAWKVLIAIIIAMVCVGCKSVEYVEVETIRLDTLHHYELQYDSIVRIDSIYEKEYVKGDTVYLEKIKYHFRDKTKMLTDTIVEKVVETKKVPVEVEKGLTAWQQFKINAGEWLIAGVALMLLLFTFLWVIRKK
jgi:hypothetical protein